MIQLAAITLNALLLAQQQPAPPGAKAAAVSGIFVLLFSCMAIVFGLAVFGFWIWTLVDCAQRDFAGDEKVVWILLIIFLGFLGAVIYYFVGREKGSMPGSVQPPQGTWGPPPQR